MRKLLFVIGTMLCLAGCQNNPTVHVVGYGSVLYDVKLNEFYVMINDSMLTVSCIVSDRSNEEAISYDYPSVGVDVVCYKMSDDDKLYFAYKNIDLNLVQDNYISVFDKQMVNIGIAIWLTIMFLVIILLIRNMLS